MAMLDFKELRRLVPIEAVVGQRVRLRRQGRTLIGRCPFHDDRGRPNLTVYPDTQTYICFVCMAHGDAVDFVARLEDLTMGEAARRVRALAGAEAVPSRARPAEARALEHLDLVYRLLLGSLSLSEEHRADLLRRGLASEDIHERAYRTLPSARERARVGRVLFERLGAEGLRQVPGFGVLRGEWALAGPEGLLVPVLDAEGRVVGIQVRTRRLYGKYRWLSTPSLPGGASCAAPAHVRLPQKAHHGVVWVTEGPLKADVVASRLGQCAVGVPGAGVWAKAVEVVQRLEPTTAILAFDQDPSPETAMRVGWHTRDLAQALRRRTKVRVCLASWDQGKGIDDALALGARPRVEAFLP